MKYEDLEIFDLRISGTYNSEKSVKISLCRGNVELFF